MHYICAVEYESGFRLRLKFEDRIVRTVDLERYLDGEIFEPLKDIRRFRTARLNPDLDTVVWTTGRICRRTSCMRSEHPFKSEPKLRTLSPRHTFHTASRTRYDEISAAWQTIGIICPG